MKKHLFVVILLVPFVSFAQASFVPFSANFETHFFKFRKDTLFRLSQNYPILTDQQEQTLGGDQQVYTFAKANGLRAFVYQDGNSLAEILNFAKLKEKKFLKYNDLGKEPVLKIGQVYYLEGKKSKANISKGYLKENESFWECSQRFGINLADLKKYNLIGDNEPTATNREIWLQTKRRSNDAIRIYEEKIEQEIVPEGNQSIHVAQEGETAQSIASHYSMSVVEFRKINNLDVYSRLETGRKYLIVKHEEKTENETVENISSEEKTPLEEKTPAETTETAKDTSQVKENTAVFLKPTNQNTNKQALANTVQSQANGFHVVQKGESLSQISKDYNISLANLMKLNNLNNKSVIKAGQKLKLRSNTTTNTEKAKTTSKKTSSNTSKSALTSNKKGKTASKNAQEAPAARRLPEYHTVTKEGETTTSVAVKYGLQEADLAKWNFLHTNQALPLKCRVFLKSPADQVPPAHHVLQKGENIYILSRKYNIEVKKLLEWNSIDRLSNAVIAGTKIKLYENEDAALAAIEQAKLTAQTQKNEPEKTTGTQAQSKNYLPSPLSLTLDVTNESLDMQAATVEENKPVQKQTADNQTNTKSNTNVSGSESNMSENMLLPEVYTVGRNMESLEEISDKFLISISDLRTYNPNIPNNLPKGSKVYLKPQNKVVNPSGGGLLEMTNEVVPEKKETPKETPKTQENTNPQNAQYDIPSFGESLKTVAERLGTTLEALLKLNPEITDAFSGDGATKIRVK